MCWEWHAPIFRDDFVVGTHQWFISPCLTLDADAGAIGLVVYQYMEPWTWSWRMGRQGRPWNTIRAWFRSIWHGHTWPIMAHIPNSWKLNLHYEFRMLWMECSKWINPQLVCCFVAVIEVVVAALPGLCFSPLFFPHDMISMFWTVNSPYSSSSFLKERDGTESCSTEPFDDAICYRIVQNFP